MPKTFKVRRKYDCLFEYDQELIHAFYEDLKGYVHYVYCDDPTMQMYTMTNVELLKYKRVYHERVD